MYIAYKSRILFLSYVFLLSDSLFAAAMQSTKKIAVIGGGIGGTSCAYFLNELLGTYKVTIDVYEANKVGGRLSMVKINDQSYESGGTIIHPRNQYMKDFVNNFGLKVKSSVMPSKAGLYDGKRFQFVESSWEYVTLLKMLWRYGLDLFKLHNYISSLLDYFDNIYVLQKQYKSFCTVSDLLSAMNSEFPVYLTRSTMDGFLNDMKYNEKLVNELIFTANTVNYGQTNSIHQFVGSVSVAGAMDGLWAVEGGNYQVARKLLQSSKAKLINSRVESVEFVEGTANFNVINDRNISKVYDILIMAAPVTSDAVLPIKFINFPKKFNVPGTYHHTICTFVEGVINNEYFGYSDLHDVPGSIFSLNKDLFFNSISLLNTASKYYVYKVFSKTLLTDTQLNMLFKEKHTVKVIDWAAYPEYELISRNDSFILYNNLYYINAIEWAASAMEMSVIGARNVALLVYNELVHSKNNNAFKDEL